VPAQSKCEQINNASRDKLNQCLGWLKPYLFAMGTHWEPVAIVIQ
jgi:hypothetical protein